MDCHTVGKRPSELVEWNTPEEWEARLCFDMDVLGPIIEKLNRRGM